MCWLWLTFSYSTHIHAIRVTSWVFELSWNSCNLHDHCIVLLILYWLYRDATFYCNTIMPFSCLIVWNILWDCVLVCRLLWQINKYIMRIFELWIFPPRHMGVHNVYINLTLKLPHEMGNRNLILKQFNHIIWNELIREWIHADIPIPLPHNYDISQSRLCWIYRKFPMKQCQITALRASSPTYTPLTEKHLLKIHAV